MTSAPPWNAVRALFEQALPLSEAGRVALLAAAERDAPGYGAALAAEVRSLLQHHEAATQGALSFGAAVIDIDLPAAAVTPQPAPAAAGDAAATRIGQKLGAWRITAALGRGGMGEVWLAERADGAFEGTAAIKVLKRGMDSDAVLARFAQEQRALARLSHPHIARLMDAGRTADGLPYFVMERVSGRAIDQACAGKPLSERLRLFLQLASAVAHAHRNLLVHRDLKPSNVMVDDAGQVKLLDFGIAKALDPLEGGSGAELTAAGERPFTPHYASPEQIRGEPVTTATDVYSLGVLLYVLLTSRRPYGREATTAAAAMASALGETPTRPSTLPPAAAAAADPQWPAIRERLRGDLETVLMKALAKPAVERYASVDALAADLRACLAGYPISARPPNWTYLAGRLLARHRWAAGAAVLGALAVMAALALALWQAQRAEAAREAAERRFAQVRQLARDMIFRHHDQVAMLPGSTATREALLADAVRFLDGLRADELADPALARETAEGYYRIAALLGAQFSPSRERLDEAGLQLSKALALQAAYVDAPGTDSAGLLGAADMWLAQASLSLRAARLTEGLQALQRARALGERATARIANTATPREAAHDGQRLRGTSNLATVEGHLATVLGHSALTANLGRPAEAEPHLRRSLALMESLAREAPEHAEWLHQAAWANQNLVAWLLLTGRLEEALPLCERMLALRDKAARLVPANAHYGHQRGSVRATYAWVLAMLGRHDEARRQQTAAAAIFGATAANDPANRSAARDVVLHGLGTGRVLALAGQTAAARAALEATLAALPATTEQQAHSDFYLARMRAETLLWLARVLPPPQAARARALAREAAALMAGNDENAGRRWALAQALGEEAAAAAAQGEHAEARTLARQALATWAALPGAQVPGLLARWRARDEVLAASN